MKNIRKFIKKAIYFKLKSDLFKQKKSIRVLGNFAVSELRRHQNQILKELVNIPKVNNVLNIGAIQDDIDKEGGYYKDYFVEKKYYTLDKYRNENHPFHYNLDVHDLSKINIRFDIVLCLNTLEHVRNPFVAISEMKSLVNDSGYLFIATPYFYPTHRNPKNRFSDYWRFTDDALRVLVLCSDFEEVWIKHGKSVIRVVEDRGHYWDNLENTTSGYCALFKKVKK